jgi:hypothetical protein
LLACLSTASCLKLELSTCVSCKHRSGRTEGQGSSQSAPCARQAPRVRAVQVGQLRLTLQTQPTRTCVHDMIERGAGRPAHHRCLAFIAARCITGLKRTYRHRQPLFTCSASCSLPSRSSAGARHSSAVLFPGSSSSASATSSTTSCQRPSWWYAAAQLVCTAATPGRRASAWRYSLSAASWSPSLRACTGGVIAA